MTSERLGNIDLRAVSTNRLYRLKPRASRSKGPPTNCDRLRIEYTVGRLYDDFNKYS